MAKNISRSFFYNWSPLPAPTSSHIVTQLYTKNSKNNSSQHTICTPSACTCCPSTWMESFLHLFCTWFMPTPLLLIFNSDHLFEDPFPRSWLRQSTRLGLSSPQGLEKNLCSVTLFHVFKHVPHKTMNHLSAILFIFYPDSSTLP